MPIRILIADDHEMIRRLLRSMIETRTGWQVCAEATNGVEAAEKAAAVKPDLVIVDLAMPALDGLHAAEKIRAASPLTPILMYTVYDFPALRAEAKKYGVWALVSKETPPEQLVSEIEKLLCEAASRKQEIELPRPPETTAGEPEAV